MSIPWCNFAWCWWKVLGIIPHFVGGWACPTLCNLMDYTVHGIFQARILEWVAVPFSRGSSQPRDQTQVSHIAGRFFTSLSHQGSPRTLEWVAYPLYSRFFPTQKLSWGLLHCRWILYQLSYQGSPECHDSASELYSPYLAFQVAKS